MKKQLIICGDKNYIDKNAESYVLIEPFFEHTDINELVKGKFDVVEDPLSEDKYAMEADLYITNLSKRMIKSYSSGISKYSGVQLNDDQWETVLCVWLREVLNDLYYRYVRLDLVKNLYENEIYTCGLLNYSLEEMEADSIRNIVRSAEKNAYLWSFLSDKMGIFVREVNNNDINLTKRETTLRKIERLIRVVERPSRIFKKIRDYGLRIEDVNANSEVMLYETLLPFDVEKKFCNDSNGRISQIASYEADAENRRVIRKYRKQLETREEYLNGAFAPRNEFESIANEYVIDSLPLAYFEAAYGLFLRAKQITKTWNLKKIYSSYTSRELMNYCFALAKGMGTKIYGIQHSGAYGASILAPRTELVFSDCWCSWGWNYECDSYLIGKEVIPVKMVRFPKYESTPVKKKNKILWVVNYPCLGRIGRGWSWDNYISNQMRFIDSLEEKVRERLVIRIDDSNVYNRKMAERVRLEYKNVGVESRYDKPFAESAKESRFVICDYHGSPDLECLLLGVPIVVFNADNQLLKSSNYKKALNMLRQAGVYAETPEKTAALINAHMSNSDEWLNAQETQKVYSEYLGMFTGVNHILDEGTQQEIYDAWYKEFIRTA